MAQEGRRKKKRDAKIHPLFAQLYLNADADEADRPRRPRRGMAAKRVVRRA